jgi:hypothetical protein
MNASAKRRSNPDAPIGFRPTPLLRAAIVKWAEHQADKPALSQAICRLVERGLAAPESGQLGNSQTRRARKMASETIDNLGDATATAGHRTARKRRLLDGPEEFSRVRLDRRKTANRSADRQER